MFEVKGKPVVERAERELPPSLRDATVVAHVAVLLAGGGVVHALRVDIARPSSASLYPAPRYALVYLDRDTGTFVVVNEDE